MTVRRAVAADTPGLVRLLRQVLEVHHAGRPDLFRTGVRKYTDDQLAALLRDPDRPVFVAVEGDAVQGYAFCVLQSTAGSPMLTDIRTLYIDDLCVDETVRGRHVGRTLYEFVVAYARAQGCYNVTLNVWACNPAAMRFYEAMGMRPQKIGMETVL